MNIAISFITDRFSILKNFWIKSGKNSKKSKFFGTDKSENLKLGGLFVVVDWNKKKIIAKKRISTPAGFDFKKDEFYISTGGNSISLLSRDLKLKRKIVNPLLNDIHSLNINKDGSLLIASTGLDLVIQMDKYGKEIFNWFATEHGYNLDPKLRIREVDKSLNHRNLKYPTLKQTTHLNSAIEAGKTKHYDNTLYCSLFHQGKVIAINKKTGESKTVLKNLKHPHAIYRFGRKIVLSNTEENSIIITDLDFKEVSKIKSKDFNWIQDTSLLGNGNFLVCDANNSRIIEFDPKTLSIISTLNYNKEWRVYQARQIK